MGAVQKISVFCEGAVEVRAEHLKGDLGRGAPGSGGWGVLKGKRRRRRVGEWVYTGREGQGYKEGL